MADYCDKTHFATTATFSHSYLRQSLGRRRFSVSFLQRVKLIRGQDNHRERVTYHTSHVTRHTSHVTRHTSHITHHTSHVTHQPAGGAAASSADSDSSFRRSSHDQLNTRVGGWGWGFVVCGLWFVVCGLWFVGCGLWFVVCGFEVCGLWFVVCGYD